MEVTRVMHAKKLDFSIFVLFLPFWRHGTFLTPPQKFENLTHWCSNRKCILHPIVWNNLWNVVLFFGLTLWKFKKRPAAFIYCYE